VCWRKHFLFRGRKQEKAWEVSPNLSRVIKLRKVWAEHVERGDKLNSCRVLSRKTRRERTLERCRSECVHNSKNNIKIIVWGNLHWMYPFQVRDNWETLIKWQWNFIIHIKGSKVWINIQLLTSEEELFCMELVRISNETEVGSLQCTEVNNMKNLPNSFYFIK
jgi:hypothetical protein